MAILHQARKPDVRGKALMAQCAVTHHQHVNARKQWDDRDRRGMPNTSPGVVAHHTSLYSCVLLPVSVVVQLAFSGPILTVTCARALFFVPKLLKCSSRDCARCVISFAHGVSLWCTLRILQVHRIEFITVRRRMMHNTLQSSSLIIARGASSLLLRFSFSQGTHRL